MKNILIVEDSSMTRSMIRSVAEEFDSVEAYEAASGFEALKMLPQEQYDLIITDINMPDINGLELINFIRKDDKYKKIPLLIISTESSAEDKQRGLAMGANAYITKPFEADDLYEIIKELLGI